MVCALRPRQSGNNGWALIALIALVPLRSGILPLRAEVSLIALESLFALIALITLIALDSLVPLISLETLKSLVALITLVPLATLVALIALNSLYSRKLPDNIEQLVVNIASTSPEGHKDLQILTSGKVVNKRL